MNLWERNRQVLRTREPGLDLLPDLAGKPPALSRVKLRRGPALSLQVPGGKGRPVTLHSPADPWKEAEALAAKASLPPGRPVVALGLGLGYHVLALLSRLAPDAPLVVVEKDPQVWWAACRHMDLTPLLARPRTCLMVHPEAREVIRRLRTMLAADNGRTAAFFGHPPSLRADGAFYEAVVRGLTLRPQPCRPLGLKKDRLAILVVNPDYFLIPEITRAFKALGHDVSLFLFDKRRDAGDAVLRRILEQVAAMQPDLVFTVNHLGFDREGVLVEALERLRIASVSWYVDSPAIILDLYQGPKSDRTAIFVWDPTYIPEVRAMGFARVHPLPLATDPEIFRPRPRAVCRRWRSRVSFVGNSLVGSVARKLARLPEDPGFQALTERLTAAFRARPRRFAELLRAENLADSPLLGGLTPEVRVEWEAAVVFGATRTYRRDCLQRLAPFQPVIYGDAGWRELLGEAFSLRPEVNYYDELPAVYGASAINFNATSLQMRAAVNQRLFDAPAAGGFLLTDFREQVAELFRPGEEVVCYREPGEIADLVRFHLQRPDLRRRIAAQARKRILAEHTYRHRLQEMLAVLRREA
jgi:spore maturation protein CgeB